MRIFGKDGKEYSSEKECLIADKKYDEAVKAEQEKQKKEAEERELKAAEEKAAVTQRKKELSKAIEDTSAVLEEKRNAYKVARKKAEDIIRNANKEAEEVLKLAAKEMEKASEDRMNAVAQFTKEFGVYRTTLTGNDAINEYNNIVDSFNSLFKRFWF